MRTNTLREAEPGTRRKRAETLLLALAFAAFAGCIAPTPGGVRVDEEKYAMNRHNVSTMAERESKTSYSMPYLDPYFTLAPGDVIGLSFYTRHEPLPEYPMQIGDTLFLEFHQQEHLNRNAVIQPDGCIPVPFMQPLLVAGKSSVDASKELTDMYRMQGIFNNVQVTASVLAFNTQLRELQSTISNGITGQIRDVTVGQDGYLPLPLADRVLLAGKHMDEVRDIIRAKYAEALPGALVDVELRSIGSNYLYVLGEVANPGPIPINKPMGVSQVIAAAGGYQPGADLTTVAVLRADSEDDCPTGRLVDVRKILNEGNLSEDVMVRRYDIVYVPPHQIKKLNDGILMYVRNMMPVETSQSMQYGYVWGNERSFGPW